MKIALLGGSFNPIHRAHLAVAEAVYDAKGYDRIVFMPTPQNPFKRPTNAVPPRERYRMVELAIEGDPRFVASDYEIANDAPAYTIDTVEHLIATTPDLDAPIGVIIGDDLVRDFPRWKRADDLAHIADVIVVTREHTVNEIAAQISFRASVVAINPLPVSSSAIRDAYANGVSCRESVPDAVDRYIVEKALYAARA